MTVQYRYQLSIQLNGKFHELKISAHSEAQAVSMFYKEFKLNKTNMPYADFKRRVNCEYIGLDNLEQFYSKEKDFLRMCKFRKIDFAYMGMRVEIAGQMATIVGNHKTDLLVVYDGMPYVSKADPRWEIVYFGQNGEIVKDCRKAKEGLAVCIHS
ncbi:TPA: hypothetical protein QCV86_003000 [Bacillus thuringiensis]|uniref:hypothetical protein n=1 Tax=Bacillus cereus group TaxID=86661 RepID=UPI000659B9C9|nr:MULTISPECIES: hypothetical protein [Bacillus cereus group]KLA36094.1 hypothetical protein B4158_5855 [Bacillus cereus]MBG9674775.1 hypothetical protein [Bacillus thuringiensis]MBU0451109.1 hypothetical protein [Bacillus thuringiensis]MCC3982593.1 hypothetical protein [Bacillus thuringiensis serovar kurstaki]MCR6840974.1 hypothetical protein [Bacillus thuringiensis]